MKFAKELDQDLVPEWRVKYLDYKGGKKKLKAVARAIRNASKSPQVPGLRASSPFTTPPTYRAPVYNYINQSGTSVREIRPREQDPQENGTAQRAAPEANGFGQDSGSLAISERQPLNSDDTPSARNKRGMTRYGSIIGSPPDTSPVLERVHTQASSLKLPGPAIDAPEAGELTKERRDRVTPTRNPVSSSPAGQASIKSRHMSLAPRHVSIFTPKRVNSMPGLQPSAALRPSPRRTFTFKAGRTEGSNSQEDIAMSAYREVDVRQSEFFMFLDRELEKIEDFYKSKEDEATHRLGVLREQLHVMRDQRIEEIMAADAARQKSRSQKAERRTLESNDSNKHQEDAPLLSSGRHRSLSIPWLKPVNQAIDKAVKPHASKTFQALQSLGTPSGPQALDQRRDYTKKSVSHEVPYRNAKHKLKIALAEFYRGLELLKSYALLNRTGFRKINKKFDKTVNARPSGRYMNEKVNKAYFVNSEVVDGHIHAVEDLYARYFERGSHKIAVNKLRAKIARAGDYTGSVFRNGIMFATGMVFGIEGVVYGANLLFDPNPTIRTQTTYLLQLYAGYFLILFLSLLFCLACRLWTVAKVNYAFIFEFDTRHHLDWRQLSEIPCLLTLVLGLILWLNFRVIGNWDMYIYWPVVLIGITTLILFFPAPILYYRSRQWFLISTWRLSMAGLYPVEFRDFFLGDLFCSQTYALGNIELFFCLYAHRWNNPPQCNSSHSRLLGFFAALPSVWRALQCLRRYRDTKNIFPHLVNCGKYTCGILYYMSLSLYRIDRSYQLKAFFIFCATINAVYCSIWDVVMDWSLLDPTAKHRFLRQTLAYKSTWPYYLAMVLDPILRFNWIFYAIYTADLQHSTLASFFVGFSEVCRRGMWMLFRVENEHCTNVGRFRASRDAPLPYELPSSSTSTLASKSPQEPSSQTDPITGKTSTLHTGRKTGSQQGSGHLDPSSTSGADLERAPSQPISAAASLRQRRGPPITDSPVARAMTRVGTLLHTAHAQDFERKRKPELGKEALDDDDDDDEEDDEDYEGDSDSDAGAASALRQGNIPRHSGEHANNTNGCHGGRQGESEPVDPLELTREATEDAAERRELQAAEAAVEVTRDEQ